MFEFTTIVWCAAGLLVGLLHATMLWRAAHRLSAWTPMLSLLRLGIVVAVLVAAARSDAILATAAAWLIGFVLLGTWLVVGRKHHPALSSKTQSHE